MFCKGPEANQPTEVAAQLETIEMKPTPTKSMMKWSIHRKKKIIIKKRVKERQHKTTFLRPSTKH